MSSRRRARAPAARARRLRRLRRRRPGRGADGGAGTSSTTSASSVSIPAIHALRPLPLGDSDALRVGAPVAAIGSPFGNRGSLSVGVVSAVGRSIPSLTSDYYLSDAIQTDAPITHGSSGGPLLDASGDAVGINAQIRTDTGRRRGRRLCRPDQCGQALAAPADRIRTCALPVRRHRDRRPHAHARAASRRGSQARRPGGDRHAGHARDSRRAACEAAASSSSTAPRSAAAATCSPPSAAGRCEAPATSPGSCVEHFRPGQVVGFTIVRDNHTQTVKVQLAVRPAVPDASP